MYDIHRPLCTHCSEYQLVHDTRPVNIVRMNYTDLITLFFMMVALIACFSGVFSWLKKNTQPRGRSGHSVF